MKKFFLTLLFFTTIVVAQRGNKDSNRIGLGGGLSYLSIMTNNFEVKPDQGWIAGMHVRGNYYNDWQMSFGMFFTDSNVSVATRNASNMLQDTNLKISAVQVYILPGYVFSENHFNVEFGPVLQINDKFKVSDDKLLENTLDGNFTETIKVKNIVDVSKFNANVYVGFNAGITNLRLRVGYQYGINNFFGGLNKANVNKDLNTNFKAHLGMLSGQLTFYL